MDYNYPILEGTAISFENLNLTRAKILALAIQDHPLCINNSIAYIRREDKSEIIFVTFDNEIPQHTLNDIKVREDVAIICNVTDNNFPEIYALRNDFKKGLSHTNIMPFEHPISLCVTEQLFCEVKHKFNSFEFIESICKWFSLTAEDNLHHDDQPLEPFFNIKGGVIIPNSYSKFKKSFLHQIGKSDLFIFNNISSCENPYHVLVIEADPQVHGFVRKKPQMINDLSEVIKIKGVPLPNYIKNLFDNEVKSGLINKDSYQLNFAIYCIVPVKRNAEDTKPSSSQHLFICSKKSFIQIGKESNCLEENNQQILPLLGNNFDIEVINKTDVNILFPIVDFNSDTAALYNNIPKNENSFVLIGVGSLGSQFFEIISRMGYGKWTIIDDDTLYPHNLAKHSLGKESLGYNKAIKVAEKANQLLNCEIAQPINSNFLEIQSDDKLISELEKSSYIIDMSTSIAVARTLARDYKEKVTTPRISSFLNPNGSDLVVLAEDRKRKSRLDFLEMQYYRCLFNNIKLNNHLQFQESQKIRYNRNSCREITNRINQADVSLLASISAKTIRKITETGQSKISIWSINNETFEVDSFSYSPSRWARYNRDGWKIYIDNWLIDKMKDLRNSKLPNETGGILIGSYDSLRKIIYVCDTIPAPNDSIEQQSSFIRGKDDLIDNYNKYLQITDNQLIYIGEWHSHPEKCSTSPSNDDTKLYSYLYSKMSKQGLPVLMSIIGDHDLNIIFKEN
ncbi:hypothetical protein HNV12_13945 [Methanococcoides sp. SA1]|nr:hypothetical protein [Methanococcoides sp. SA1]